MERLLLRAGRVTDVRVPCLEFSGAGNEDEHYGRIQDQFNYPNVFCRRRSRDA